MSGTVNARPVRVQLSRKRGWRMPPNTVIVARPSKWGNPFKAIQKTRENHGIAVKLFDHAIRDDGLVGLASFQEGHTIGYTKKTVREELKGKNLACWCPLDWPCHADVLLELANGLSDGKGER